MPKNFGQFTSASTIGSSDFLVGYNDPAAPGKERRWLYSTIKSDILAAVPSSSSVTGPGVAKAWIVFDGRNPNDTSKVAKFGISSVAKTGLGDYTIYFTSSYSKYALVATCHEWNSKDNNTAVNYYVWTQPYGFLPNQVSLRHHTYSKTTTETDPPVVSVVIFAD